jgi:hypothetical protein
MKADQRTCIGCGKVFIPKHIRQLYHTPSCRWDHAMIRDRENKRKARKSSRLARVNFGALIDLYDKEGPVTITMNGMTYQFSALSKKENVG